MESSNTAFRGLLLESLPYHNAVFVGYDQEKEAQICGVSGDERHPHHGGLFQR